jgi:hypothetical protein
VKIIVADTGPLIHLHEAEAFHLLSSFQRILLPPTVFSELKRHAPDVVATGLLVREAEGLLSNGS